MKHRASLIDRWVFALGGHDLDALKRHGLIADDERSVAYAYGALIALLCATNFVCMSIVWHDAFVQDFEEARVSSFLWAVWLGLSGLVTWILWILLRLVGYVVHARGRSWATTVARLLFVLPIWIVFPALGLVAAVPIQTRVLTEDVRIDWAVQTWKQLGPQLLHAQLKQRVPDSLPWHPCVEALSKIESLLSVARAHREIGICEREIGASREFEFNAPVSRDALGAIRTALASHGMIDLSATAFRTAPWASMFLVGLMMLFYSSPFLLRNFAHRRAWQYLQDDQHRHLLALKFGIEVHAHDAFNQQGLAVPMTRYRGVERQSDAMRAGFEEQLRSAQHASESVSQALKPRTSGV